MPKIVILGSCRFSPYEVADSPMPIRENAARDEADYQIACKRVYPAIDEASEVWIYMPEGKIGEHTQRDLDYARSQGKRVFIVREEGKEA